MEASTHGPDGRPGEGTLELTVAGGLLLSAALFELLFHRAGWVLGLYATMGAEGPLALRALAGGGRLAVNLVAVLGLFVCLPVLARMVFDHGFGPWAARVVLAGLATGGMVISLVTVFLYLSPAMVLAGYVFAAAAAALALLIPAFSTADGGRRRIALGLALIIGLPAAELTARATGLTVPGSGGSAILSWSYLLAEVLIVVVPIFAFFSLNLGRLGELVRRPPLPVLGAALAAVALALAVIVRTGDPGYLSIVSNRILGITIAMHAWPALALYLAALFFGVLLVGLSLLPRGGRRPDPTTRRFGLGLALVLIAGLQPSAPYLFISMLLGALLAAHGLFEGDTKAASRVRAGGEAPARDASETG